MSVVARDVMQTQVVTIEAEGSLLDAQRLEEEINGARVVDADGRVIGVLSAISCAARSRTPCFRKPIAIGTSQSSRVPIGRTAGGFPESNGLTDGLRSDDRRALTFPPDAPVEEIARTLRQNRIHRVLIAENGALVGIVASFDLMALPREGAALALGAGQSVSAPLRGAAVYWHPAP